MSFDRSNPSSHAVVFWTGGFDSSFRILQLAIVEKQVVQPIYINTGERLSTPQEIAAMDRIREEVENQFGATAAERILPTEYDTFDGVGDAADIARAMKETMKFCRLGIQYVWLANYMRARQLDGVEMGMHWTHADQMKPCHWVKQNSDSVDGVRRIAENPKDPNAAILFGYYHFPILELTKADMRKYATENGLMGILRYVHFCHNPRKDGTACGRCGPCKTAAREGLADLLPLRTRYLYLVSPLRQFLRRRFGI